MRINHRLSLSLFGVIALGGCAIFQPLQKADNLSVPEMSVKDISLHADGDVMPKPSCGDSTTAHIFVSPATYDNGGAPINGIQTYADANEHDYIVHLRLLTDHGWVHPEPRHGQVTVVMACEFSAS